MVSDRTSKRILPWLVAVALFMEMLDTTILNTAVPTIASALGVRPLAMKSVLSSYSLSLAVFIPVSGWVADRFGTRRVFTCAIALFTLGSMLCGVASDIGWLVAFRVIQGIGGALMVPVGRLTLVRTFEKAELVRAMTYVTVPALIGPMLGPLAGGVIVGIHWRLIFFVNIPIGVVGLFCVRKFLPDYRASRVPPLDVIGVVLFGTGIALLSYLLEVFGEHTLGRGEAIGILAFSLALLAAYGRHAMTYPEPLLRLDLLHIRTFRVAVVGSFITRLGAGGLPFLLPLLYQIGFGFSPIASGLLLVPQSLAAIVLKFTIPQILARVGYRAVLLANTLAMGVAIMAYFLIGPSTPLVVIILLAGVLGFSASLQYTSMNTLAFADIDAADATMASTIASTMQQMSMSFGIATASLSAVLFIPRGTTDPETMIDGVHKAFIALGALTFLSAFVFTRLHADDGNVVAHHDVAYE
jgi:EmrB/QacA subfamily drug resistance transporter